MAGKRHAPVAFRHAKGGRFPLRSARPNAARPRGMPPHHFPKLPFASFWMRPQISIISSNGVADPKMSPDSTIFR